MLSYFVVVVLKHELLSHLLLVIDHVIDHVSNLVMYHESREVLELKKLEKYYLHFEITLLFMDYMNRPFKDCMSIYLWNSLNFV